MTVQVLDSIIYKNKKYSTAHTGEIPFNLQSYGIISADFCSACRRGYLLTLTVRQKKLFIRSLNVNDQNPDNRSDEPRIDEVAPELNKKSEFIDFEKSYSGLNIFITYSGSMLIGRKMLYDPFACLSNHSVWSYQNIIELNFENGIFKKTKDLR
jgi:hypothetical protein